LKEDKMKRDEILKTAGHLISKDRHDTYGDSATSHSRIAAFWSAYLSVELSAVDVAAMMVLMKVSRSKGGSASPHLDNFVDICGYAALAGEMAAESVKDAG
jgi:hypothetical protein|tara:strand:+ start:571 stop:873 length:303 start_codon:yes stop_codon:yes gene_type:complete